MFLRIWSYVELVVSNEKEAYGTLKTWERLHIKFLQKLNLLEVFNISKFGRVTMSNIHGVQANFKTIK